MQVLATEMNQVYFNVAPDIIYLKKKKKKKTKDDVTLGTIFILFQELLNMYTMDQTQYHITHPTHGILKTREYYKHQNFVLEARKLPMSIM